MQSFPTTYIFGKLYFVFALTFQSPDDSFGAADDNEGDGNIKFFSPVKAAWYICNPVKLSSFVGSLAEGIVLRGRLYFAQL
jgi:hypothetical protein